MKKTFIKSIAAISLLVGVLAFSGCSNTESSSSATTVPASTATQPSTSAPDEDILKNLHTFDINSEDPFSGVWQITDGQGAQYKNFVYMFDGNGIATLFIGNTGYIGKYDVAKDQDGNQVFTTQLMFGLNGSYSYEFDETNVQAVLTDTETESTTTLTKLQSFDCIPIPETNVEIDEALLGAWSSETGEYFYFDKNGIMYNNMYNAMFTYSIYNAKDGKLTSSYSSGTDSTETDKITDTYDYSFNQETLVINDIEYKKIEASKLE